MTITASEPGPLPREHASDAASVADAAAVADGSEWSVEGGARGLVRRLRLAPPVQLELVSGRQGPAPEVVWASLPERSREQVLVLLARLIDSGCVEEREGGG